MVFLPMNPARDCDLTIDMIGRAKLLDPRLEVSIWKYTPYPGTDLYDRAREKGFVPPTSLEGWANHTLRDFQAPWAVSRCERKLRVFRDCYFRMLNREAYRRFLSPAARAIAYPVNKLLFSLARLRAKTRWYGFPVESKIMLGLRELQRKRSRIVKNL